MSAAEKGWQPIESEVEGETRGFSGGQPMLRTGVEATVDPALRRVVDKLPENEKKEAHREVEIELQLTQDQLDTAKKTLEHQKAQVVLEAEIVQVWYDTKEICEGIDKSTSLTSGTTWVCQNMQVRVRSIKTANGTEFHWAVKIPGGRQLRAPRV